MLSNPTLKEINKLLQNKKFDTQFKIKDIKKELLQNKYLDYNGRLQCLC